MLSFLYLGVIIMMDPAYYKKAMDGIIRLDSIPNDKFFIGMNKEEASKISYGDTKFAHIDYTSDCYSGGGIYFTCIDDILMLQGVVFVEVIPIDDVYSGIHNGIQVYFTGAIMYAAKFEFGLEMIKYFMRKKFKYDKDILYLKAAVNNDLDVIKYLRDNNIRFNKIHGVSMVYAAVENNNLEMLEYLINNFDLSNVSGNWSKVLCVVVHTMKNYDMALWLVRKGVSTKHLSMISKLKLAWKSIKDVRHGIKLHE